MTLAARDLTQFVSYHAVTRYVQRLLGVELPADEIAVIERAAMPSRRSSAVASAHCAAVGLTVEQVQALIMVPAVAVASASGITRVSTSEFVARLSPEGVVVTVTEVQEPHQRMKQRGRKEMRRDLHRHNRRNRKGGALR